VGGVKLAGKAAWKQHNQPANKGQLIKTDSKMSIMKTFNGSTTSVRTKIELIDEKNSFIMMNTSIKKFQLSKKFSESILERSYGFEDISSQFLLHCAAALFIANDTHFCLKICDHHLNLSTPSATALFRIQQLRLKALCLQRCIESTDRSEKTENITGVLKCLTDSIELCKQVSDRQIRKKCKALAFFHLGKLCL
jgi:hypothetical protein